MIKELCTSLLCLLAAVQGTDESNAPTQAVSEFTYACAYVDAFYGVQCGDLQPPLVITSRIVSDLYYGLYIPGEPYVFINKQLWVHDKTMWSEVVVHETTHYILDQRADLQFDRCDSEEAARRVAANFTDEPYSDDWRDQYRC